VPNQRKPTKSHLGGYFDKSLVAALQAEADARGIDRSQLVAEILEAAVAQYKRTLRRTGYPVHQSGSLMFNESLSSGKDIEGTALREIEKASKPKKAPGAAPRKPKQ